MLSVDFFSVDTVILSIDIFIQNPFCLWSLMVQIVALNGIHLYCQDTKYYYIENETEFCQLARYPTQASIMQSS